MQHRIAAQHARHAGQLQKLMTRRHVSLMARCQHWPQRRRGRRRGLAVTRGGCRRRARQSNRAGRGGRRRGVMKTWSCFDPWVRADNRTNNNAGASLGASVAPRCSVARCRTVLLTFIARTAVLRSVIANVHVECYRQTYGRMDTNRSTNRTAGRGIKPPPRSLRPLLYLSYSSVLVPSRLHAAHIHIRRSREETGA